jgi:hypothetical protein
MRSERKPLRFRGAPNHLIATLRWPGAVPHGNRGLARLGNREIHPVIVRGVRSAVPAVSILSFRLPRTTRPGKYEGTIELGTLQVPMIAEVEPRPHLRILPHSVAVKVRPGERITTEIMLVNLGNVDIRLESEYTFCVFDNRGLDFAIFRCLTGEDGGAKRRVDRFVDDLAESHGGLVRVMTGEKAARIAPEEVCELEINLHFSRRLRPGHTYNGAWTVSQTSFAVEVETIGEKQADRRHQ